MTVEKNSTELIRIWQFTAAPSQYKELFRSASELYWIALAPADLVWEFTQQLWLRQSFNTDKIQCCRLSEGATLFCGPLENE